MLRAGLGYGLPQTFQQSVDAAPDCRGPEKWLAYPPPGQIAAICYEVRGVAAVGGKVSLTIDMPCSRRINRRSRDMQEVIERLDMVLRALAEGPELSLDEALPIQDRLRKIIWVLWEKSPDLGGQSEETGIGGN